MIPPRSNTLSGACRQFSGKCHVLLWCTLENTFMADEVLGHTMSVGPADSRYQECARQLERHCAPLHYLCVTDVTDGHAVEGAKDGRALRADGRDLKVLIVSTRFRDKSGLERQEVVNAVLYDYIRTGAIHSVQMRCWDPDEWVEKGAPVDLGAPCSFSSKRDEVHEFGQSLALAACTAPPDEPPPPLLPEPAPAIEMMLCDCGAKPLPQAAPPPPRAAPPPPQAVSGAPPPRERRRVVPTEATPVLVEHLRAQGIRGLETAQAILKCEHASAGSREAASQFLAEQVLTAGDW